MHRPTGLASTSDNSNRRKHGYPRRAHRNSLRHDAPPALVTADETCNSPYLTKLIKGQEDYVHVWALGVEGSGDGSDKLVTIDANPKSKQYGKVIHKLSVGGRGEAHHMGFTDDRRYLWAGGLDDSKIYVFDVGTNPAKPTLVRTIADLPKQTGFAGPHTFYALPGRMLIQALSNTADRGGVTGIAVYNNKGQFVAKYAMPVGEIGGVKGDGYGYDLAINPAKNVLLTSSFSGSSNYMRSLGELVKDEAAMKRFGNTMAVWDLKAMKPQKIFAVPGAPLEIRWSLKPGDNWAIVATALTSKLWLIKQEGVNGKRKRSARSPTRPRSRCPWTSASPPTARAYGSTRSWTARRVTSTSPTLKRRRRSTRK